MCDSQLIIHLSILLDLVTLEFRALAPLHKACTGVLIRDLWVAVLTDRPAGRNWHFIFINLSVLYVHT